MRALPTLPYTARLPAMPGTWEGCTHNKSSHCGCSEQARLAVSSDGGFQRFAVVSTKLLARAWDTDEPDCDHCSNLRNVMSVCGVQEVEDSNLPSPTFPPAVLPISQCAVREIVLELSRLEPFQVHVDPPVEEVVKASVVEVVASSCASSYALTQDQAHEFYQQKPVTMPGKSTGESMDGDMGLSPASVHDSGHFIEPASVPLPELVQPAELCVCTNSDPINICMMTQLLDTACSPLQHVEHRLQPSVPQPEHIPLQQQQPVGSSPTTREPPSAQDQPDPQEHMYLHSVPEEHDAPRTAAIQPSHHPFPDPASFHPPHTLPPPRSPQPFHLPPAPAPTQALTELPGASAVHVLEQLEAILSCRSMQDLLAQLRSTIARPDGALVMWLTVLTPLLTIFLLCFTLSVALQLARVVLGAMSNICSASSHFTLQRLGAIARKLVPEAPSSPVRHTPAPTQPLNPAYDTAVQAILTRRAMSVHVPPSVCLLAAPAAAGAPAAGGRSCRDAQWVHAGGSDAAGAAGGDVTAGGRLPGEGRAARVPPTASGRPAAGAAALL